MVDNRLRVFASSSDSVPVYGLVDAADTLATIGGVTRLDLDVALVTPSSSPRVTHDIVLDTVIDSIADSTDGVVDLRTAARRLSDDARVVHLEGTSVSGDSHVHWPLVDSMQVGVGVALLPI